MSDVAGRQECELRALSAIAKALGEYSGQKRMLLEVLHVLEHELAYLRTTIMLLSSDGQELVVDAVRSGQGEVRADATYSRGEGITGQVLKTGKPAVIGCIRDEPEFRSRVHQRERPHTGDLSFICVPIVLGGEPIGTLSTDLLRPDDGDLGHDERFLGIVASLIANDAKLRRYARQQTRILEEENRRLRGKLHDRYRPENIIGNSHQMQSVYQAIHQVAQSETTVLIRGESGTGKELVASAVHYSSHRADRPFVRVNCAALSESLLESELFGHEKGAFTGAVHSRVGRIEQAEGGTLFLDEIGDFSPGVQVKLLRVLQEREYSRVGSNDVTSANVRIVCATNRNLEADVESGRFRNDLYYRINVFPIRLPALRDRKEDIPLLVDHFVTEYAREMGKTVSRVSTEAIDMMVAYHWPGNVRELENCIEHAVLLCKDGVIHGYTLPPTLQVPQQDSAPALGSLKARVQLLEKDMIIDALKQTDGNVAAASRVLGITARMVRYKIKNLDIDYPRLFKKNHQ
jgi:Nif-specific regulatory protein